MDCYRVWAFYILHALLIAWRQIWNILLWLFFYSVVAYEIGQMLKEIKKCYIFILLLLEDCVVAFKCAFKVFQGKSLCLGIKFYLKVKQPKVLKVCVRRKQNKYYAKAQIIKQCEHYLSSHMSPSHHTHMQNSQGISASRIVLGKSGPAWPTWSPMTRWPTSVNNIYLDFCKVFDIVSYTILLEKLEVCSLDRCTLQWVKYCLDGWGQSVLPGFSIRASPV